MPIVIEPTDPRLAKARKLVEELDALLISLYPMESNHLVAIDRLAAPDADARNPGGHVVSVAIADVAHYVREGSALDREALVP